MASKEYEIACRLLGTRVSVFKKMVRDEDEEKLVYWKPVPVEPSVVGVVTGIRWKQIGYYHSGGHGSFTMTDYGMEPPEYEGPSFEQKKTIPVLLVVDKPQHKPRFVPFDGFREVQAATKKEVRELKFLRRLKHLTLRDHYEGHCDCEICLLFRSWEEEKRPESSHEKPKPLPPCCLDCEFRDPAQHFPPCHPEEGHGEGACKDWEDAKDKKGEYA